MTVELNEFNLYMIGVGGQGIGLLSEILLRDADHAGFLAKGVDTHGLAQRGGVVISQLRIGKEIHSPIISKGKADLVIALERHEALRGLNFALQERGTLIYYDTVWQPLGVRLGEVAEVSEADLENACAKRNIRRIKVCYPSLKDPRTQNIVVLSEVCGRQLIPGIESSHYENAMKDLMEGKMLESNLHLFRSSFKNIR
ncbi:MAG: 2-oxoacid:acceptor oxidoreductase family protein [Thermodesulfobacteriota bacterium]